MTNYILKSTIDLLKREIPLLEKKVLNQTSVVRQAIDTGGGMHDNAMYDAALNDQRVLAARLDEMRTSLQSAEIIDIMNVDCASVTVGTSVTLKSNGERKTYAIVGAADVIYNQVKGGISHLSPVAISLMGKLQGEEVLVKTPSHEILFSVENIEKIRL